MRPLTIIEVLINPTDSGIKRSHNLNIRGTYSARDRTRKQWHQRDKLEKTYLDELVNVISFCDYQFNFLTATIVFKPYSKK